MNTKKIFSLISFIACSFSVLSCMKFSVISEIEFNKKVINKTIDDFVGSFSTKSLLGGIGIWTGNIDDIVKDENGEEKSVEDRKAQVTVYECDAEISENVCMFIVCLERKLGYPYEKIYFEYPKEKKELLNVAFDVTSDGTSNEFFYNVCKKLYPAQTSKKSSAEKNKLRIAYIEIKPFFECGNLKTFLKFCASSNQAGIKPFITGKLLDKIIGCVGSLKSSEKEEDSFIRHKNVVFTGGDYSDLLTSRGSDTPVNRIDAAILISPNHRKKFLSNEKAYDCKWKIGTIYEFKGPKKLDIKKNEQFPKKENLKEVVKPKGFGEISNCEIFTVRVDLPNDLSSILKHIDKV